MSLLIYFHLITFILCFIVLKIFKNDHVKGCGLHRLKPRSVDKSQYEIEVRYLLLYWLFFINLIGFLGVLKYV